MEATSLVAIEIASSKIKGAAAVAAPDGRLTVLAVEEVHAPNSVRHGRVQNVREVSAAVNDIIRKLEANPAVAPRKVMAVTLSLGGRSLGGTPASATLQFGKEIEVSEKAIKRLRDEAEKDFFAAKNIEETIARNYYVNNVLVSPAVGTVGSSLRGDFLMLTCARENRQNLERLKFESIRSGNVEYRLRPLALAEAVLSDDDRQLGCALVDFGAETTTISVYKNGTLAFLSTLPMGSRLITRDLMAGLTLTEAAAEDFKITLGDLGDAPASNSTAEEVNNYVRARAGEIAANIVNQIELSAIGADNLGAGIILTGGGSRLPEFGTMLSAQSHLNVRNAVLPANVRFVNPADASTANIDVVALLMACDPELEGLSPLEMDEEPAKELAEVPEIVEDPEPEALQGRQAAHHEKRSGHRAAVPPAPKHRYRDDDDDDLLGDDPDNDDDLGDEDDEDGAWGPYDEDDENGTPGEGGDDAGERKPSLLGSLKVRIARIFTDPEEDDKNDY